MFLFDLNWIAIAISFVAFFALGAIWFGPKTFFPAWVRLMGLKEEPGKGFGHHGMAFVFGLTAVGALVQVVAVASVIHFVSLGTEPVGPLGGALTGFLVGVGFTAAGSLSHRLFAGHGVRVWLIEVGSDILGLTVAGLIIGAFGG
jgi:hypothetical protein